MYSVQYTLSIDIQIESPCFADIDVAVLVGNTFRSDCSNPQKTNDFLNAFESCGSIDNQGGKQIFNCAKTARYVALRPKQDSSTTSFHIHIYEIQVFGQSPASQPSYEAASCGKR